MRKINFLVLILAILVFNIVFVNAAAEEDDEYSYIIFNDNTEVSIEKSKETIEQIPASITIINQAQIKAMNCNTLGELLRSVPGCIIGNDPLFDHFIIRGIGSAYDYNTRVLVLIDGHTLNENIGNSVLDVGERFLIPMESIEKIEIIRGSGSVIYGTSAFVGVINVITKQDWSKNGIKACAQYGSFNYKDGCIQYSNHFNDEINLLFSTSQQKTDGDKLLVDGFDNASHKGIFTNDYSNNSNYFFKLNYKDLNISGAWANFFKNFFGEAYDYNFNSDYNFQKETRNYIDIKYNLKINDENNLSFRSYYDLYDYLDSFDYLPDLLWYDSLISRSYGFEIVNNFKIFNKHNFTFGFDICHADNKISNGDKLGSEPPYVTIEKNFNLLKTFVKDDYKFNDELYLNLGLQYNHHQLFKDGVIFRCGLIYNISDNNVLKTVFNQGFRSPTVFEAFYHDTGSVMANPNLDKEQINTYEIILENKCNDNLSISSSIYYSEFNNLISTEGTENLEYGIVDQYVNNNSFSSKGFEASIKYRNDFGFELGINGTYQNCNQDEIDNFSKHMFNITSAIPLPYQYNLTGALNYVGKRKASDFITNLEPYTNMDLGLLSPKFYSLFDVWLGVKNLLDDEITSALGPESVSLRAPFRGRAYYIKLSFSY